MAADRYAEFLPTILYWNQRTLEDHADKKKSVASFKFPRLPRHFSTQLLNTTSVVITDRLPVPPLSGWGLSEFADFEKQPMSGITYLDMYFLRPSAADDESVHFHELVHIVHWQDNLTYAVQPVQTRNQDGGDPVLCTFGKSA